MGLIQSMHLLGRKNVLNIYGHPSLLEIIKLHNSVSETYLKYPITFHELTYNEKKLIHEDSKTKIYSLPMKHRIPTCGFLFEEKERDLTISKQMIQNYDIPVSAIKEIKRGKDFTTAEGKIIRNSHLTEKPIPPRKYAFCSDTIYNEKIVDDILGFDLLYHEATFLDELKARAKETFHSTASQAATIAQKAKVKKLLLGHFSVRYKEMEMFLTQAQAIFTETSLAQDGMTINL
jgi:ribonuclease Z